MTDYSLLFAPGRGSGVLTDDEPWNSRQCNDSSPSTEADATQSTPVDYGRLLAWRHRGSASGSCSFGALMALNGHDHHGPWTGGTVCCRWLFLYIQPCLPWPRCHGSSRRSSGYQIYIYIYRRMLYPGKHIRQVLSRGCTAQCFYRYNAV